MNWHNKAARTRLGLGVCACVLGASFHVAVLADTATSGGGGPNSPLAASARLDFALSIGQFIFFRVGSSAYPAASTTIDTVALAHTIPPGAVVPTPGNDTPVIWDGTAPATGAASLPVEVRSNAGQVSIIALITAPLTSGGNTIPMSSIVVTSDDAALPAPVIPAMGFSAPVGVTGTNFSNLVTLRAANWTFSYSPPGAQASGVYTGQIRFIAYSL